MLMLDVLQGPDRGMRFGLPADEPQLIGRSSEALPLRDTTVSRRHAELTPDDGRWFLRDLDSANGTFVNGVKVAGESVELAPGAAVEVDFQVGERSMLSFVTDRLMAAAAFLVGGR